MSCGMYNEWKTVHINDRVCNVESTGIEIVHMWQSIGYSKWNCTFKYVCNVEDTSTETAQIFDRVCNIECTVSETVHVSDRV